MPYKTFIDISMGILQEIVLCICLKKVFLNQIAAILELAAIATLKRKKSDMETFPALLIIYR